MNDSEQHKLSTSALAKALDIPLQQLFGTLRDCGWIRKLDDGWALTAKGEFEGGEYVHSKRYGRYIVWPEVLLEHQLLRGIESNRLLNSAQIARKYQIGAREVRRLLGDLGLLTRTFNGWQLTREGERLGGVSVDSDHGDITWPETLLENTIVNAQLAYLQNVYAQQARGADAHEGDLLDAISEFETRDGHRFRSRNEALVCDWLYFAGIAHACGHRLPLADTQDQRADFWLPAAHVYIEVGGDEREAGAIAATLRRIEIYRRQQWRFVEVRPEHFEHLDDFLTRALGEFGVRIL